MGKIWKVRKKMDLRTPNRYHFYSELVMKISTINIARLRVQEDFGFQELVKNETDQLPLLESASGYTAGLKTDVENHGKAFGEFDTALKAASSVPSAAEVSNLDRQRDDSCTKLYTFVRGVSGHPDKEKAKIGAEAVAVFKKYGGGSIVDQPQNQESGTLRNLIQDFRAMDVSKLTQTGIKDFVDDLEQKQTAYLAAVKKRAKEERSELTGVIKQKRKACDEAYLKLIETVNALVVVNGDVPYRSFVESVTSHINHQKSTLANRQTNADKKPKDPKQPKQPKQPKEPKPQKPGKDDGKPDIHLPEKEEPKKPGGGSGAGKKPDGGSGAGGGAGTGGAGDSGNPDIHLPEEG